MKKLPLLLISHLLLLNSCISKDQTDSTQALEIASIIGKHLTNWNLSGSVMTSIKNDTLNVEIFYNSDLDTLDIRAKSPYYYDQYTNELIIQALSYLHMPWFNKFAIVYFQIRFENAPDIAKFYYNKQSLDVINHFFENQIFFDNIIKSLNEFNYDNIIFFDSNCKYLLRALEKPNLVDNYWELLRRFSMFCADQNRESLEEAEVFLFLSSMIKQVDLGETEPDNAERVFIEIIKGCDIDETILDLDFQRIHEYLEAKVQGNSNSQMQD